MIRAVVLGAAAGGGFPQWNSNGASCRRARGGLDRCALPRTQASLAVSSDGLSWFLLNASPDLRQQIAATPRLHPREGLRSTPIAGVLLTGGEVDTIAGLLSLRERQALRLVATEAVLRLLDANPIFEALDRDLVPRERVALIAPASPAIVKVSVPKPITAIGSCQPPVASCTAPMSVGEVAPSAYPTP